MEGFYGPPWAHRDRLEVLRFLGTRGMNTYVYAPKNDPKHRARWREPYDETESTRFQELTTTAREAGLASGFALSPGLDLDPESAADRRAVADKMTAAIDAGFDWLVLAFDDIPFAPDSGVHHAGIATEIFERLERPTVVVPTDYAGVTPTPYLRELAARLPAEVHVMWTGPSVVPATVSAADARRWSDALGGRRPLIWDNYPVNDTIMAPSLHLAPLVGREPELAHQAVGLLANPMSQARASLVALATVAEFLTQPDDYDPEGAWKRAIADVAALNSEGGSEPVGTEEDVLALARACATSALHPPEDLPLHRLLDAFERGESQIDDLERELGAAEGLAQRVGESLRPWAVQAEQEAGVGRAALGVLRRLPEHPRGEGTVLAALTMLHLWTAVRASCRHVVYGPRLACYPAVRLEAGEMSLDTTAAVIEDASAIDRLCRLALRKLEEAA